jgi:N-acyl-D-aspartate/D-glutamate deacylase
MTLTTSCAATVAVVMGSSASTAGAVDYDLVIANGRIVDGTGAPWFRADVGIRRDRIAIISDLSGATAAKRIDARGRIVAPGFIDMLGQSELHVLVDGRLESKIRQGITTEITGELSTVAPVYAKWIQDQKPWLDRVKLTVDWTDLDGYWERFRGARPAVNMGTFVGAAQVRAVVMGEDDVPPTAEQLARMEAEVEKAMRQGALGVSSALDYAPASYARADELVALAKVAARFGGIYATHVRGDAVGETAAGLEEAIGVARAARIPMEIWHLKVAGRRNWGGMRAIIDRIERARAEGVEVTANVYPYLAGANALWASVPPWARSGGQDKMVARFHDPEQRRRILAELRERHRAEPPGDVLVVWCEKPELRRWNGQRLDAIARAMERSPEEALLHLIEQDDGLTLAARFLMSEDDLRQALRQPWISFGLDAPGQAIDGPFAEDMTHPRAFGSLPRILGRYVREERLLSVEEAVRRMTSLPARRVRLFDRGLIRPGIAADIVVFDPGTIRDVATFEAPLRYSEGVTHVVVNGKVVLDDGKMTTERPGRSLQPLRP